MVCRWLQVCLGAPGGAPGDMGVIGGDRELMEVGVRGGLRKWKPENGVRSQNNSSSDYCV